MGRFPAFLNDGEANSPRWKNKKTAQFGWKSTNDESKSKSGQKTTIVNYYQDSYFCLNKQSRVITLVLWTNHLSLANWGTFDAINDLRVSFARARTCKPPVGRLVTIQLETKMAASMLSQSNVWHFIRWLCPTFSLFTTEITILFVFFFYRAKASSRAKPRWMDDKRKTNFSFVCGPKWRSKLVSNMDF